MAIEMKVPPVGESITEVSVATWNKKDGDMVQLDEVLCELESDKATFELPAEATGILRIVAKEGDVLPIGALICTIEAADATSSPAVAAPSPEAAPVAQPDASPALAAPAQVVDIKVPAVGESITEVSVSTWHKKTGDAVQLDEVLCELESDKATFELPAETSGTLEIIAPSGTVVPIGGLLAKITVGAAAPVAAASAASDVKAAPSASSAPAGTSHYAAGHPSPAAAKILEEKGIAPEAVAGSGVGGRITKEDAMQANAPKQAAAPAAPAAATAVSGGARAQRREKMTSLRKTVARRLVAVKMKRPC